MVARSDQPASGLSVGSFAVAEGGIGYLTSSSLDPLNALGDSGQVAFELTFTNGLAGVFVATVPEPATLAALGGGMLLLRRRRRA